MTKLTISNAKKATPAAAIPAKARKKRTVFKTGPRVVEPQDAIIGQKIKVRRSELKISQSELGEKLGVSFQQVQKYEKGVNRVSAGRLHHIAKLLDVSTDYFYDAHSKDENEVQSLLYVDPKFALRLLRAYIKLPVLQRRHIITLMEAMAGEELAVE